MNCETCRELLSAGLDGEATPTEQAAAAAHRRACVACAAYAEEIEGLHRLLRVRPAEPVPDLTAAILAAAPPPA